MIMMTFVMMTMTLVVEVVFSVVLMAMDRGAGFYPLLYNGIQTSRTRL